HVPDVFLPLIDLDIFHMINKKEVIEQQFSASKKLFIGCRRFTTQTKQQEPITLLFFFFFFFFFFFLFLFFFYFLILSLMSILSQSFPSPRQAHADYLLLC